MSELFCANCGTEVDVDSRFCMKCGYAVKQKVGKIDRLSSSSGSTGSSSGYNYRSYRSNVQIIAVLEMAWGLIIFLFSFLVVALVRFVPQLVAASEHPVDPEFYHIWPLVSNFVLVIFIFLIIVGFFNIIVGFSLYRFNQFGRIGSMILGALNLFSVPIGTLFGIATLYLLTRPEAEETFS